MSDPPDDPADAPPHHRAIVRAMDTVRAEVGMPLTPIRLFGSLDVLRSRLPVSEAAAACIGSALAAAAALAPGSAAELDLGAVGPAVRSEAHLRVAGRPLEGFAPLSRFWRATDGWIRTHANYRWHRAALLSALGLDPSAEDVGSAGEALREAVERAISALPAEVLEQRVVGAGGIAVAVRTREQWAEHPQGLAVAERPLVVERSVGGASPRRRPAHGCGPDQPMAGLRVLDLTRVIAGPVATRYLAALGAQVLRLDAPHRPELPMHQLDGLPGKRSALLDARTATGLTRLHDLLDGADVLVHGYRPGALEAFGLGLDSLAARHPGLVVVSLSAWGTTGPWRHRRGFDSIVQAASGIAWLESPDGVRPGALPCQLLDHGTGYLAAAVACEGLRRQWEHGGTFGFELALASTARWLARVPVVPTRPDPGPVEPEAGSSVDARLAMLELTSPLGPVTMVAPPGRIDGRELSWPTRLTGYGSDRAEWLG